MICLDATGEALARWIESGTDDALDLKGAALQAEILRAIMTGVPVRFASEPEPRRVKVFGAGVKFANATIDGELDLSSGRSADGHAMPPLVLSHCTFAAPVGLVRAKIRILTLRYCKLTQLDAPGLHVEESLDISSLSSAEAGPEFAGENDQGLCWVELQDCQIVGQFRAVGAVLVGPVFRPDMARTLRGLPFALDLTHAHIGDSVLLGPDVRSDSPFGARIHGGVSMVAAQIGGDVICDSAEFSSIHGPAFRAQGAKIGGSVSCRVRRLGADNAPVRFRTQGNVDITGAKIGGRISFSGAEIDGDLLASHIESGADVRIKASTGPAEDEWDAIPFVASGQVNIHSAKIKGDFDLRGASFGNGIVAPGIEVLGDVRICHMGVADDHWFDERWNDWPVIRLLGFLLMQPLTDLWKGGHKLLRRRSPGRGDEGDEATRPHFSAKRIIDFSKAVIRGSLFVEIRNRDYRDRFRRKSEDRTIFDLRFAHIGVLDDDDGDGFGTDVLLKLDEVKYEVLHRTEGYKNAFRIRPYLWSLLSVMTAPAILYGVLAWRHANILVFVALAVVLAYAGWIYRNAESTIFCKASSNRKRWLNLQYRKRKATAWEYTPEPYQNLSRYLRSVGLFEDARNVATRRQALEQRFRTNMFLRPFVWLYGMFFRYGLSPVRAIVTFVACILLGYGGIAIESRGLEVPGFSLPLPQAAAIERHLPQPVSLAGVRLPAALGVPAMRIGRVLVLETETVNSVVVVDPAAGGVGPLIPGIPHAPGNQSVQNRELACGELIDPFLYAVDLFVPALDLNQEGKCRVSSMPDALIWRRLNSAYMLLGWIVTALTILTVSGILRRRVELE